MKLPDEVTLMFSVSRSHTVLTQRTRNQEMFLYGRMFPLLVHSQLWFYALQASWWWKVWSAKSPLIPLASVCLNVCTCPSVCPSGSTVMCVLLHRCCYCCCCCYCYYCCYCCFSSPHLPQSILCPSTHPKLGEKSDPLQSNPQVLREARPVFKHFDFRKVEVHQPPLRLSQHFWPLTVQTCFKPAFLLQFFFFFLSVVFLSLFCLRSHSL